MGFWRQPQQVWFRRALFQIHLWTGVIVGLYIIVPVLLSQLLRRALLRGGPAPLQRVLAALGPVSQCTGACVPFNFFGGVGSITPEMLGFVAFDERSRSQQRLNDYTVNLSGELFAMRDICPHRGVPLSAGRIVCKDGWSLSVQAGDGLYSNPRESGAARYNMVEVGYVERADGSAYYPRQFGRWSGTVCGFRN